jgi:signal transduction histidine kinase
MPLWTYFTLGLIVLAGAIVGAINTLTQTLVTFVTPDILFSLATRVYGVVALLIVFAIGFFLILAEIVIAPIEKLARAIDAFAEKGERLPLETSKIVPREIRRLTDSSRTLMENVAAAHKRDMEVSQVKSDFISTAAHQFRTPLTGIRWALEALEASELTKDQHELVKNAADKSRELVGIVGTLLDISAIESGKYKYVFEPLELSKFLSDISRDFQELAKTRGVNLYFADIEQVPAVRADKERIRWVLNNLIENAIRYTPSGGAVTLSVSQGSGRIFVKVHDTGIGISAKDSSNIFERFFRAENAVSKESQGNGLGLYIARTIATDHGGDLNFEANQDGPGTTFTLSLPISGPAAA